VHPRPVPQTVMAQVDFAVHHPDLATPWLVESFAGVGSTWQDAIGQGVATFERSVLHPLIAGLLDRTASTTQVDWQTWRHPTGDFDACLGRQLVLYSDADLPPLAGVLDRLRDALAQVPLTHAIHSLRIFTCHQQGALVTNEVLLDGQPWPAGQDITMTTAAPNTNDRIGTRLFTLLIPRHQPTADHASTPDPSEQQPRTRT
jgi:hypothetical protein